MRRDSLNVDAAPEHCDSIQYLMANCASHIKSVRSLTREAHLESRFRGITFSQEKVDRGLKQAIDEPSKFGLLIAVWRNQPVGFLFCVASEFYAGSGAIIATVHTLYVSKRLRITLLGGRAALGLLNGAVRWARSRQACEIMVHVTSGIDTRRTDRLLKRTGFEIIGANYAFGLKPLEDADG